MWRDRDRYPEHNYVSDTFWLLVAALLSALNATSTANPSFGQIGPGLNAANMDARGWLDPERVWRRGGWFDEQVQLYPHHRRDLEGYLVARVGIHYVELRVNQDWDAGIGSPVVLIHRLDANRSWLMAGPGGQRFLPAGAVFERVDSSTPGEPRSRVEVIAIDPGKRQATVRLSYQPTIPPVPNVVGKTAGDASNALQAAGFTVQQQSVVDHTCNAIGRVMNQSPGGGTYVTAGSTVTIRVGERPPHPCP